MTIKFENNNLLYKMKRLLSVNINKTKFINDIRKKNIKFNKKNIYKANVNKELKNTNESIKKLDNIIIGSTNEIIKGLECINNNICEILKFTIEIHVSIIIIIIGKCLGILFLKRNTKFFN